MATESQFQKAVDAMNNLPEEYGIPQDVRLQLHASFQQATAGDVNTEQPDGSDAQAKAEWGAWNALNGTSAEAAREIYVGIVLEGFAPWAEGSPEVAAQMEAIKNG